MLKVDNEDIELKHLLGAVYEKYGYDFRTYSRAHVKRRVLQRVQRDGLDSISALQYKLLDDVDAFNVFLGDLSINVTEMFRDPGFFLALRTEVVPILKTYPFLRIWNAGCASGEEAYSVAILLKEEGLYERAQIYATDFNDAMLQKNREAIYPIDRIKEYSYNYQRAGGKGSLADYYTAKYDAVMLHPDLKERIVFANHNLTVDGVFGEMNLILCRNVLIYFNRQLQDHVVKLFSESLCGGGFLCLGAKESIQFSKYYNEFEVVLESSRIYKKKFQF